ncbi:hypothetical protein MNBD_CHLOROFLEXI01-1555 [hydrothermal vent metagenome]|uniref:Uncharacterized protein n=1 Tax=hydrothermal vent metagenome TaxID=652676 RepID=A0A3B0VZA5_9ZZZZ
MLIACTPETTVIEVSTTLPQAAALNSLQTTLEDEDNDTTIINENRCQTPSPADAQSCAALEEQILASTVRIELHRWQEAEGKRGEHIDGGIGHATVKDGRYLVTHNHFPMSLDSIEGLAGEQIRITIYKADGEVIIESVQSSAFTIVFEDSETVVLDFGEYVGEGLFAMLGIPSAEFYNWQTVSLAPGMEVAQINWDNETAHVEWVNIKSVLTFNGTPQIELDKEVIKGASGGGVFWNGIHIGNNWKNTTVQAVNDGAILEAFSTAALNSEWVNG